MKRASFGPNGARLERHPDIDPQERARRFGVASPAGEWPTEVVAGEATRFAIRYRAGAEGLPTGASIGIMWRLPADWGAPQFDQPEAPNHVTVGSEGSECSFECSFSHRGGVPPHSHLLCVSVRAGALAAGETVLLNFASVEGWEAPTASLPEQALLAAYRPHPTAPWQQLADLPPIPIVPGVAATIEATAPSACCPGDSLRIIVRGVDRWGNVSRGLHTTTPTLEGEDFTLLGVNQPRWDGVVHDLWHLTVRAERTGMLQPHVRLGDRRIACNRVECDSHHPHGMLVWGDLHGGQGELGVGQGSLARYFQHADEVAGLQFTSHQANDVYVTAADWGLTRRETEAWHRPGAFITLLGCEWTAAVEDGGDHNVVYLRDQPELYRAQRWFDGDPDWPLAPTPADLYERLAGSEALINLHVGGFTSDLAYHEPRLQRLIEIHSTHATSRWFVADGLERGYRLGVVGGSDGISGRPGACQPGRRQNRNLRSGLTGLYVDRLSRQDVWSALRARRCFATNGARIALLVEAEGVTMGGRLKCRQARLRVRVRGTAAVDRIVVRRGGEVVQEARLAQPTSDHPHRYRLLWQGSRSPGAARHQRLDWQGTLSLDRGRLRAVATLSFESATDRLTPSDERTLAWQSVTAGNEAGFLFDLEGGDGLHLKLTSPPLEQVWRREELDRGVVLPLPGILDGSLRCDRAPDEKGAWDVDRTLELPPLDSGSGEQAWWVEVVQIDGGRAWSSPIFITAPPAENSSPAARRAGGLTAGSDPMVGAREGARMEEASDG